MSIIMKKILKRIFLGSRKRSRKRRVVYKPTIALGLPKKEFQRRKKKFKQEAEKRVKFFARQYGVKYGRVSVRNQKTRWGSCSAKKNLNFNYRIFLLDQKFIDYLIVHEICHLKHMNHSKDFWAEVEKEISDYKNIRKEMKKYYFRYL